jgi:ribosomal protein S18 acetylase RimI-like enzyme
MGGTHLVSIGREWVDGPVQNGAMQEIRTRPMTQIEFDGIRSRMAKEYAAEHVAAGDWPADEAEARAERETDTLLPQGVSTPGMVMLVAETPDGDYVGRVWLALERTSGSGGGAWIYDIEIAPEQRGKGFGRAVLDAAEREAANGGADSIGLNVFGGNLVARSLYESSGYDVTAIQMSKPLGSPGGSEG